jgi:hypothetical protein
LLGSLYSVSALTAPAQHSTAQRSAAQYNKQSRRGRSSKCDMQWVQACLTKKACVFCHAAAAAYLQPCGQPSTQPRSHACCSCYRERPTSQTRAPDMPAPALGLYALRLGIFFLSVFLNTCTCNRAQHGTARHSTAVLQQRQQNPARHEAMSWTGPLESALASQLPC